MANNRKNPQEAAMIAMIDKSRRPFFVRKRKTQKPTVAPEYYKSFNKSLTRLRHIVNPICQGFFKELSPIQNTRTLKFPGAELQLIYNCARPHVGKRKLSEVATWFEQALLASESLKKALEGKVQPKLKYKIDVKHIEFEEYVQVIITFITFDFYEPVKEKFYPRQ